MNILPKKRWHVRTKENIARVRKDEAEAAEKEREERSRIENANREARLSILKQKSKSKLQEFGIDEAQKQNKDEEQPKHINFFTDIDHAVKHTNKEHDKEIKEKKEEYEKKIGYLTYLGQDTNEALKKKNWYELTHEERFSQTSNVKDTYEKLVLKDEDGKPRKKELDVKDGELDWKAKQRHDPINKFKKYCRDNLKSGHNLKKSFESDQRHRQDNKRELSSKDKDKKEKDDKLQKLREARMKREQQEKYRTELFLSGLNKPNATQTETVVNKVKPKYNSQFNPELARQNYR